MAGISQKSQHDHIFNLQVQGDKYARLLLGEKKKLQHVTSNIADCRAEIVALRQRRNAADERGGGVNAVASCFFNEQKGTTLNTLLNPRTPD